MHFPPVRALDNPRRARCPAKNRSATQWNDRQLMLLFQNNENSNMDTIYSPVNGDLGNNPSSGKEVERTIPQDFHEKNITEGGEFLDDAIRMEDL